MQGAPDTSFTEESSVSENGHGCHDGINVLDVCRGELELDHFRLTLAESLVDALFEPAPERSGQICIHQT